VPPNSSPDQTRKPTGFIATLSCRMSEPSSTVRATMVQTMVALLAAPATASATIASTPTATDGPASSFENESA